MLRNLALGTLLFCAASSALPREDVRFWHALSRPQAAAIERLAARFNAMQKEYRVRPSYKGALEVTFAQALAVRHSAAAPHIVQIHESLTDDLIAEQLVVPLWQVMADARQRFDAALFPALSSAFSDERGRLLALPFASATPVLYYNRDALRRAQLASLPATWYEMPAALGALSGAGSSCPFTSAWPAWVLFENMSAWHNQEFVTQDNGFEGAGTQLVFNSRLMVRWIAMLSSWRKAGYFVYSGRGNEAEARFLSGECALLTSSSASYPVLRARAKFDLGVAPLPYYDDFEDAPQNTLAGGAALWVLAGKPKKANRGAARFLAFLARPDVQAEWQQMTGFVPLTMAGYELARKRGYYLKQPGNEIAVRELTEKIPTGDSKVIRFGDRLGIRGIIDEELETVWSGAKTPLDALNAAVERGNLLLLAPKRSRAVSWPYPRIVAHRGGGALAPENTLGAIRLGAALGFRGVEFDVMLAGDGTPVLIHDETTERTTGVKGRVALMKYSELEKLDAGNGEVIPRFQKAAALCRSLGLWANVEIKPAGGRDRATGEAVASSARELWRDAELPPVLSSFSIVALEAAQAAAPELPRAFLTDELPADWEGTVRRLGCVSIHCNHEKLTEEKAKAIRNAGYALLCWTVNDPVVGRRLLEWSVDCLVTDALRTIGPDFAQARA